MPWTTHPAFVSNLMPARIAFEEILARWPSYAIELPALERLPSLWVRAWKAVPIGIR